MADSRETASGGIGLCGGLFLLFTGLKLAGFIDWSWWWVTAPLWLPTPVILVLAIVILLIKGIYDAFKN